MVSPSFFDAHLAQEVAKSKRYGRRLSVAIVRAPASGAPAAIVLRPLAAGAFGVLRAADLATLHGDELRILLPETDRLGAMWVQERIAALPVAPRGLLLGSASLPDDPGDGESLLRRARLRAEAEANAPWGGLRSLDFWEAARRLAQGALPKADALRRGPLGPSLWRQALAEGVRELARASTTRGLLIACGGDGEPSATWLRDLLPLAPLEGRVVLGVGRRERCVAHPSVEEVFLGAEAGAERLRVLLFLAGHAAYGMLADEAAGVHFADEALVRILAARFRDAYDLH